MRRFLVILSFCILPGFILAQTTKLKSGISGSGGLESESTNFRIKPVIGQAAGGQKSSTSFAIRSFILQSISQTSYSADPFISSFTPNRGGPESTVTITGGFFGTNATVIEVLFGTTQAANITLSSPTQIIAVVPSGVSGPVNITVSVNGINAVSGSQFTIIPPPQIQLSSENVTSFPDGSSSVQLKVDVTHDYGISIVEIRYRALRAGESSWQTGSAAPGTTDGSTTTYTFDLTEGNVDELGVVYSFEATDEVDNTANTGLKYLYRSFPGGSEPAIPGLSFGGTPENWRMFSIPYQTDSRSVSNLFSAFGSYDEGRGWRLVRWNQSKNDFDEVGKGISSIEEGKGYWFNAKEQQSILVSNATAPNVTDIAPKSITLQPGWNQIGNPYPFTLDWNDILQFNGITEGVSTQMKVVSGGTSLQASTTLNAWSGAYVENSGSSNIQLYMPFRPFTSARIKSRKNVTNPLDFPHWEVIISLESGIYSNMISKIGMLSEAMDEKDPYDESRVPRLAGYLDLNFDINGIPHSASLRSAKEYDSWDLTVDNNLDNEWVQLTWDNSYFGDNQYQLILHDLENEKLVSMRVENSYSYRNTPKHRFRVYYGTSEDLESKIQPSRPILGQIYPNPFNSEVMINYTIAKTAKPRTVNISVYDIMGKQIENLLNGSQGQGFYQLTWDSTNHPAGVYLVRMTLRDGQGTSEIEIDTRRIIKQ